MKLQKKHLKLKIYDDFDEFEDDLDIDDYENLDFDENWN